MTARVGTRLRFSHDNSLGGHSGAVPSERRSSGLLPGAVVRGCAAASVGLQAGFIVGVPFPRPGKGALRGIVAVELVLVGAGVIEKRRCSSLAGVKERGHGEDGDDGRVTTVAKNSGFER